MTRKETEGRTIERLEGKLKRSAGVYTGHVNEIAKSQAAYFKKCHPR